jgi:predicted nucleic acid-binding protein
VIFADTGALFAFCVRSDVHHADAVRAAAQVLARREPIWTIDPVLTELWRLLRRDISGSRSDAVVGGLLERGLQREPLEDQDYSHALVLGQRWADQEFSLTGRQAFAVLERTGRQRAWSYDDDFAVIRLGPARNRPLDLVR